MLEIHRPKEPEGRLAVKRQGFIALIVGCAEVYGRSMSEMGFDLYWNVLGGYDLDEVERAVKLHIGSSTVMPTPCHLVNIIEGGSLEDHAAMAWPKVRTLLEDRFLIDNAEILLSDGAAAMAARALAEAGLSRADVKYSGESFKALYKKYYLEGYRHTPLVFKSPASPELMHEPGPPSRYLPESWWGPEAIRRHYSRVSEFSPGHRLVLRAAPSVLPTETPNQKREIK